MIRKYAEIFCWKNVSSFCSAKATHIFSAKNIRILYIESAKTVNEMTLNELIKLTTLWTTGPRTLKNSEILWKQRPSHRKKKAICNTLLIPPSAILNDILFLELFQIGPLILKGQKVWNALCWSAVETISRPKSIKIIIIIIIIIIKIIIIIIIIIIKLISVKRSF